VRHHDLNYQHLRYFHAVAQYGSVKAASQRLGLAPSTISGQISTLEETLGRSLFERVGRGLVLTPFGEEVLGYAAAIFDLGDALVAQVARERARRRVHVGVSAVLPKLLVRKLILPLFDPGLQLEIEEGPTEELLGRLATRRLEVVLSDAPAPPWVAMRATSHPVVQSGIAVFGTPELAAEVGSELPRGLAKVPWLVPAAGTSLRAGLEAWWDAHDVEPDIAAVVHDSALLKSLGDAGVGIFAAPEQMLDEVLAGYRVECIGTTNDIREEVFAITRAAEPREPVVRKLCGLPPLAGV
jgi:LysR family transcriptional activator of nhaA